MRTSSPLKKKQEEVRKTVAPTDYRFIYPEFLPDPKVEWRNVVREKLERLDMVSRRAHIDIPEFYVGKNENILSLLQESGYRNKLIHRPHMFKIMLFFLL